MNRQWFGITTWLLVVTFSVATLQPASASNEAVRLRARVEAAHVTGTRVTVKLADGNVLRGRVVRLNDATFVLDDDKAGCSELAFASVASVKSDRTKWIIVAALAAAVVVFLVLRSQCFYQC